MYGKLFETCFTGSMYGSGPTVFATWSFIIANAYDSMVEVNPKLLAGILGTTADDVQKALDFLTSPDPQSRNKEHEGRRLVHHGAFLYFVPSWQHYNDIRNAEERKEYMREYMRKYRKLTDVNGKEKLAVLAPSDVASDVKDKENFELLKSSEEVLAYLNQKAGTKFRSVNGNLKYIIARLSDQITVEDCRLVIDSKVAEWGHNPDMRNYLRPETIFGKTKFEGYLGVAKSGLSESQGLQPRKSIQQIEADQLAEARK